MPLSMEQQIINSYPILTGDEIAKKLNIGRTLVYRCLHKNRIEVRRSGARKGITPWNKGKKDICKPNNASFKKGNTPWNKGTSMPKKFIENMRAGLQRWCKEQGRYPNWRGGLSFEPYSPEFNNQLKYEIRKRDKFICQFPNCGRKENGKAHDCHHINYNKKDSNPDNLTTLCSSCHVRTNGNREFWQYYFEMKEN